MKQATGELPNQSRKFSKKKGKNKDAPAQPTEAYWERAVTTSLTLNFATKRKWAVKFTARPLYPRQSTPVPTAQDAK